MKQVRRKLVQILSFITSPMMFNFYYAPVGQPDDYNSMPLPVMVKSLLSLPESPNTAKPHMHVNVKHQEDRMYR